MVTNGSQINQSKLLNYNISYYIDIIDIWINEIIEKINVRIIIIIKHPSSLYNSSQIKKLMANKINFTKY